MARSDVVITVAELRALPPERVQVLDVRWSLGESPGSGRGQFLDGHLPGARFLDLEQVLTGPSDHPALGRHPLPCATRLAGGLGTLGIDPELPIVVYDRPGSFAAGRAWWVLRWAGLDARMLDGGLPAWVAAGGEQESGEPPQVSPTRMTLTLGQLPTLTADEVADFDGVLIDARAPERFRGESEPIDPRAGHIPGAVNRPVSAFFGADGRLPSEVELAEILDLPPGKPVAVYCGSGVSATAVLAGLASLGVQAALYPPSWSGWSSDPERPAAVGE